MTHNLTNMLFGDGFYLGALDLLQMKVIWLQAFIFLITLAYTYTYCLLFTVRLLCEWRSMLFKWRQSWLPFVHWRYGCMV